MEYWKRIAKIDEIIEAIDNHLEYNINKELDDNIFTKSIINIHMMTDGILHISYENGSSKDVFINDLNLLECTRIKSHLSAIKNHIFESRHY